MVGTWNRDLTSELILHLHSVENKKTAVLFIFLTVMVDMIGIGVIIPVIPALITELTGIPDMDSAAIYGMWLITIFAGMQFLFSPMMGELSDRFGRKPLLLLSLFILSLDYLAHAFAPTIGWLFLARFIAGISGSSHTVATAYMADISTPKDKAKNFGLIGAAFGLGFIIGPGIGGIFGEFDSRLPFLIAAGLTFFNFLMGLFFVPESLPREKRRPIELQKMIPGVSLIGLRQYSGIGLLITAYFLVNVAGQALPATWSYFSIEKFNWSEQQIGFSLMFVGLVVSLVQGLLIGKLVGIWGQRRTILIGFTSWTIGMSLFALASEPWMLYAFTIPYAFGGIASPTLQSLVSNQIPDNEQGNLQGALTGMVSLTAIVGPILSSSVFAYFIGDSTPFYFPGAPYAICAVIFVVASILAFLAMKKISFVGT